MNDIDRIEKELSCVFTYALGCVDETSECLSNEVVSSMGRHLYEASYLLMYIFDSPSHIIKFMKYKAAKSNSA